MKPVLVNKMIGSHYLLKHSNFFPSHEIWVKIGLSKHLYFQDLAKLYNFQYKSMENNIPVCNLEYSFYFFSEKLLENYLLPINK